MLQSATFGLEGSELRKIERDLRDGAQLRAELRLIHG
jgi:hypothetical protein